MKRMAMFSVTLFVYAVALAQDSLVGTYTGSFLHPTGRELQVRIEISSVRDGLIQAVGYIYGAPCKGKYDLVGTIKDNSIVLQTKTMGGPTGDCPFLFRGLVKSDGLVGAMGNYEIHLRK